MRSNLPITPPEYDFSADETSMLTADIESVRSTLSTVGSSTRALLQERQPAHAKRYAMAKQERVLDCLAATSTSTTQPFQPLVRLLQRRATYTIPETLGAHDGRPMRPPTFIEAGYGLATARHTPFMIEVELTVFAVHILKACPLTTSSRNLAPEWLVPLELYS
jgi:hypothetical protein